MEGLVTRDQIHSRDEFVSAMLKAAGAPPNETFVKYEDKLVIAMREMPSAPFRPIYHPQEPDMQAMFNARSKYRTTREEIAMAAEACADKIREEQELHMILNRAFPPLIWRDDDKILRRRISTGPATKADLIALEEALEEVLEKSGFHVTGLDPDRSLVFENLFNELIRQELVHCRPRGLLLLRIRDELRMSIDMLERLYLSSTAHCIRKAISTDKRVLELDATLKSLKTEKQNLVDTILSVQAKLSEQDDEFRLSQAKAKAMAVEEKEQYKRIAQGLKANLETHVLGSASYK